MALMTQVGKVLRPVNRMVFEDSRLITKVVWNVFVRAGFSEAEGHNVEVFDEWELDAIKITNIGEVKNLPSKAMAPVISGRIMSTVGGTSSRKRVILLIKHSDMPTGASHKDVVIFDDKRHSVVDIDCVFNLYTLVEIEASA